MQVAWGLWSAALGADSLTCPCVSPQDPWAPGGRAEHGVACRSSGLPGAGPGLSAQAGGEMLLLKAAPARVFRAVTQAARREIRPGGGLGQPWPCPRPAGGLPAGAGRSAQSRSLCPNLPGAGAAGVLGTACL